MAEQHDMHDKHRRRRRVNALVGITVDLGCAFVLALLSGTMVAGIGYLSILLWKEIF